MLHRLIAVLTSITFSILVLELMARAISPTSNVNKYVYDEIVGHRREPNLSGVYATSEFDIKVSYNSKGFRDKERTLVGTPGCQRVAVLGDSYIEGIQVEQQDTFSAVLEKNLRSSRLGCVEVLSFGISGYGTAQEYLLLKEEVLNYSPSLVILGLLPGNDIRNNSIILDQATSDYALAQRPYFVNEDGRLKLIPPSESARIAFEREGWKYYFFDSSALIKLLHQRLSRLDPIADIMVSMGFLAKSTFLQTRGVPTDYKIFKIPSETEWKNAWQVTERLLVNMNETLNSRGIGFLVMVIPSREQIYSEDWEAVLSTYPEMRNDVWDLEYPNRRLEQIFKTNGIVAKDLLPSFRLYSASTERLNYRKDGHWTAYGHERAADEIAKFLTSLNWLKKP